MIALLEHAESVASTNDEVSAWIRQGCADGRALWAGEQTAGRGRRGRTWVSPAGLNLAMSVAIVGVRYRPAMLMLPLAAAVGVAEAVEALTTLRPGLKWPNDLLYDDRKLGGILCEAVLDGARFEGAVIGIGVNVNSVAADMPQELRATATSIRDGHGGEVDLENLAQAVRRHVCACAARLAEGDVAGVLEAWRSRDATRGKRVVGAGFEGAAMGIGADGALLVQCADGVREVRSGEVTFAS